MKKQYIALKTGISHSNITYVSYENSQFEVEVYLEERFCREKNRGEFPISALRQLIKDHKSVIKEKRIAFNSCTKHPRDFEHELYDLQELFPQFKTVGNEEAHFPEHHLCHALSGIVQGPFEKGYVVVCDGVGSPIKDKPSEKETLSIFQFDARDLKLIHRNSSSQKVIQKRDRAFSILDDIGSLYMNAASFIFGKLENAGKVMGLSTFGQSEIFPELSMSQFSEKLAQMNENQNLGKNKFDALDDNSFQNYADIAFSVQKRLEERLFNIFEKIPKDANVILVGGVFLNCIFNSKLLSRHSGKIFTPANPDDYGISLGAAVSLIQEDFDLGEIREKFSTIEIKGAESSAPEKMGVDKIENAFEGCKLQKLETIALKVANLLAEGHIVAWVQGRSEIGPRALGRRSLLAPAGSGNMKTFFNDHIKFRESFRPYGASILKEEVTRIFEVDKNFESPYMSFVARAKDKWADKYSDVLHNDQTSRIQTVTAKEGLYYQLLKDFYQLTGEPLILNTSLNIMGEPIVESLKDVAEFFKQSEVMYLAYGDYLISKEA